MTKQDSAKLIWLEYFNRSLKESGMITEEEYRKMNCKIKTKYPTKFSLYMVNKK